MRAIVRSAPPFLGRMGNPDGSVLILCFADKWHCILPRVYGNIGPLESTLVVT